MNNVKLVHDITGYPNQLNDDVTEELDKYGLKILSWQLSTGGRTHQPRSSYRKYVFYSLCQMVKGDGWYIGPDDNIIDVPVGSMILVCPEDTFGYGGKKTGFTEDFITFNGRVADNLRSLGIIRTGLFPALNIRKIKDIVETAAMPDVWSQIKANTMLQDLLLELCKNDNEILPLESSIRKLLGEITNKPEYWWTINEMASYCGVCEVHFRRVFKKITGTSPKKYLERIKMGLAANLLVQSDISVSELAAHFKYRDPYHFSRRFKINMGLSPEHYKKDLKL